LNLRHDPLLTLDGFGGLLALTESCAAVLTSEALVWVPGVPRTLDVQCGNDEPPAAAFSGRRSFQNTLAKIALGRCGLLFVTKAVPSILKHLSQIRNGREIERHRSIAAHALLQIAVTTADRQRRYYDNAANFSVRLLFFMRALRTLRASTSACCELEPFG
jgi:hypothetical protein